MPLAYPGLMVTGHSCPPSLPECIQERGPGRYTVQVQVWVIMCPGCDWREVEKTCGTVELVPKGGLEPPRVSPPPPQDGVSASSTTSAQRNVCELTASSAQEEEPPRPWRVRSGSRRALQEQARAAPVLQSHAASLRPPPVLFLSAPESARVPTSAISSQERT